MVLTFNIHKVQIILFLTFMCSINTARHFRHRTHNYARNHSISRNTSILTDSDSKVNVTIYYETHCPYCINFFRSRLGPTMEVLSSRMNIHMVPYGNAKTTYDSENRQYMFRCQHGPIECYGNKIHACAIDLLQNSTKAALFNVCLMTETYSYAALDNVLTSCGAKFHIQTNDIRECVNSKRGSALLREYGDQTHALSLNGVPSLMLDGEPSEFLEYDLCRLLRPTPRVCISTFGSIFS
ncbi:GILT-like protein 2 [Choristoneura fumiferana]|uniref:GILT-like protein 2 n=1 Tax=Choristoneura fumiferana TaxID=7141 RepID=UPI003D1543B4